MKNYKAEGIDNILIEMLKTFGEKSMKELVQIYSSAWRYIPQEYGLRTS